MVVGADFAWGHLGKTGGDATWKLFRCVPDLVEFAHDPSDPAKHLPFRRMGCETKLLVLNLRRLPSVTLSFVHHARLHGLGRRVAAGTLLTPEEAIAMRRPERELEGMLAGQLSVHRWLRMERLREDFLDFVRGIRPLTGAEVNAIRTVETKAPASYDHDPDAYFDEERRIELYRSSPRWARAELEVYGDLPVPIAEVAGTWREDGS
jgi:hypothetical protein